MIVRGWTLLASLCGACLLGSTTVEAQRYSYSFTTADPLSTSGSFTFVNSGNQYKLTSFAGVVGGVNYNAKTAGFQNEGNGNVAIGVDTERNGFNNFQELNSFQPGIVGFYDDLIYSKAGGYLGASVRAQFTNITPPATYEYDFTSADPASTSGSFSIGGVAGAFRLLNFSGVVGGVSYTTANAGFQNENNGAIAIGVDTERNGLNNFQELDSFFPGISTFADTLIYSRAGSFEGNAVDVTFSNVSGVPEPATWAMMMLGFGMIGFGLRRRGKVSTTSVSFA